MRLRFRIPGVEPNLFTAPQRCKYDGCDGQLFELLQCSCTKALLDTAVSSVKARRVRCLTCGRTFRIYPKGVSRDQQSDTIKTLSVALYGLGLSYAGTAHLLEEINCFVGKTTVYRNVRAAGRRLHEVLASRPAQVRTFVRSGDTETTVGNGDEEALIATVTVNSSAGVELVLDVPEHQPAQAVTDWILEVAGVVGLESLQDGQPQ